MFLANFAPAVVAVKPFEMKASGEHTLDGKKICIEGDEKEVEVPGCQYTSPIYPIPGTGTLKIAKLDKAQVAEKTQTAGTPAILMGDKFQAIFEIDKAAKAKAPPKGPGAPPEMDAKPSYKGFGYFKSNNKKYKGT